MTAADAIKIVRNIAGNVDVCVDTNEWHMTHIEGDGVNRVEYRLSIQPGIGGAKCSGWSGDSILDCVDESLTAIIRSGFHKDREAPPIDVDGRHSEDAVMNIIIVGSSGM